MKNFGGSTRRIRRLSHSAHPARFGVLAGLAFAAAAGADNLPGNPAVPSVEVIGVIPLPDLGSPLEQVPANVQTLQGRDLERQKASDLTEFLSRNLGGVNSGAAQNNPFQPDVIFRGSTASPLLGTPQGLSVFVDGVRVNESFGDTVNWDLIPPSAISSISLVPGSDPLFGLNTIGGTLSINTKSGFTDPGAAAQASTGSFGRTAAQAEWGGHGQHAGGFVTANAYHDDGWAEHNQSEVRQLFGKTGWQDDASDLDLSFTGADNSFFGNQALPRSMLDDPRQAYTWPDRTINQLAFLSAKGDRYLTDRARVAVNAYYRRLRSDAYNSNVNDQFNPASPVAPGNMPAANVITDTNQSTSGGSLQLTLLDNWAGHANRLTFGASVDRGRTDFAQFTQESDFTADRGTPLVSSGVPTTHVDATNTYYGVYATDTLTLADTVHLTVSGRSNQARIQLSDKMGTALNGVHRFRHFSPAVGLTINPKPALTAYVAFNEGLRAPNPVELTCADPNAPCSLPNLFLSDPELAPVISRTWEGGMRGHSRANFRWSAALFRTELANDIQFVSAGATAVNAGFFENVGDTRRQGIELALHDALGGLTLDASYTLIDATFRTALTLPSPNNSQADANGDIRVLPGDTIPGIPRQLFKLRGEYSLTDRLAAGAGVVAASAQYARGDENNQDINGALPGYAVVNLDLRYRLAPRWQAFGKIDNLFDRRYATFGMLGRNVFTGPGNTFDYTGTLARPEQFRSVAPPRGIWIGLRYAFDGAAR